MEACKEISVLVNRLSDITLSLQASQRYSLYPIEDEDTFSFYNRHASTVWTNVEMDFTKDKEGFSFLPPDEQHMVSMILAFFSSADGVILNNLAFRFILEARTLEEKSFYIVQQFMELIHSEAYSLAIDSIISDPEKRKEFFLAADNQESVIKKNKFMEKYLYSDIDKPYRLVAFACAEGIFFISAFLIIFWFRSRGILPNLIFLNEQISKDETLHRDFACHLVCRSKKEHDVDSNKVRDIVKEAVEIEIEFVSELLTTDKKDLSLEMARRYIHRLANNLLVFMNEEPLYEEKEVPNWINDIAMQQKSNTYEVRGGNYHMRNTGKKEESFDYQSCDDF